MSELRRLQFGEGMLNLILTGQKRNTIRTHKPNINDFVQGEIFIGEFEEGIDLTLRITADTLIKPLSELSEAEAHANGYRDSTEALKGLRRFYIDLQPSGVIAIISFEIHPEVFAPEGLVSSNEERV